MNEYQTSIRMIQHYLYCPHRWGLLEIENAWSDNAFVVKANILHDRVHDSKNSYYSKGKNVFTSVSVYNDEYGIYGVTDCIEVTPCDVGVKISGKEGLYSLCIVEYKPTKPKNADYSESDLMQVFAQKLCVDSIFECDCDAVIYYADKKQRVSLPLRENFHKYDEKLKIILQSMDIARVNALIPPVIASQNCNGCSLKDYCMPTKRKSKDIRLQILSEMED